MLRWILLLQEFDWEIRDKKGSENLVADHLSRVQHEVLQEIEDGVSISDEFAFEQLLYVNAFPNPYWYADFANFACSGMIPSHLTWRQKKKFLHDAKFYFWEEPLLFK